MTETQNFAGYLLKPIISEDDVKMHEEIFLWWSEKTKTKKETKLETKGEHSRLVYKTPEELKKSLYSIFVFTQEYEIVGAAGVFPCIDKISGDYLYLKERLLGELGSIYVNINHRDKGIGSRIVDMRLDYIEDNDMTPIMITQDLIMTLAVLNKSNIEKIDLSKYSEIVEVCMRMKCTCREMDEINGKLLLCEHCPLNKKSLIGFKRFEQYY